MKLRENKEKAGEFSSTKREQSTRDNLEPTNAEESALRSIAMPTCISAHLWITKSTEMVPFSGSTSAKTGTLLQHPMQIEEYSTTKVRGGAVYPTAEAFIQSKTPISTSASSKTV